MLVLINQFKPKPASAPPGTAGVPTPFTLYSQACMNKLFQNCLVNAFDLADFQRQYQISQNEESRVLKLMDKCLMTPSTWGMMKAIKVEFKQLFEVERVNILLVNRFHKFFYKIKKNKETGSEDIVKYDM